MDFTKIRCISEQCKDNNVIMGGNGGSFGGRVDLVSLVCPVCKVKLLIVPMRDEFEYSVSAMTKEERREQSQKERVQREQLELLNKILELAKS